jgi:Ni/Fe-hydrogenase 1 B-type cytochrome subunit
MNETIHRVLVWPAAVRLLHILMASSVLILCVTGALLYSGLVLNDILYWHLLDVWHLPAGHVLAGSLVARLVMLVLRSDVAGWRALVPESLEGVVGTAIFYLSMARMNLPGYYAHNPLWKPVYLVMFILLLLQVSSGLMLEFSFVRSVFRTDSYEALQQHQALFLPLLVIVVLHIITSILHDWKSGTSDISAMVNGHKHFTVEGEQKVDIGKNTVSVSLDSLHVTKDKK